MSEGIDRAKLENFERGFSSGSSGCVRSCECGRRFYSTEAGYTWEEGEFEELEADPEARGFYYSISTVVFEGKEYCVDCDCWHERANKIIAWLDGHASGIAEYLSLEKERKTALAKHSPVVRDV